MAKCGSCGGNGWALGARFSQSPCRACNGTGALPDHAVARSQTSRAQAEPDDPQRYTYLTLNGVRLRKDDYRIDAFEEGEWRCWAEWKHSSMNRPGDTASDIWFALQAITSVALPPSSRMVRCICGAGIDLRDRAGAFAWCACGAKIVLGADGKTTVSR